MIYNEKILDTAKDLMGNLEPNELKQLFQYLEDMDFGKEGPKTLEELILEVRYKDGKIYCPHCGAFEIIRKGYTKSGSQRFYCKGCKKTFVAKTKTIFEKTKLTLPEIKALAKCMLERFSITKTKMITKISSKTIFNWRHKLGFCLNELQEKEVSLGQIVEVDETYFNDSFKGNHFLPDRPSFYVPCRTEEEREIIMERYRRLTGQEVKATYPRKGQISVYIGPFKRDPNAFVMPRPPRDTAAFKAKRGLSTQQQGVVCAVDRHHNCVTLPVGLGNCSYSHIERALSNRIEPQSTICTDYKPGYLKFAKAHGHRLEQFMGSVRTRNEYGIQNINNVHGSLKDESKRAKSVSSKHIADYLALWVFATCSRERVNPETIDNKLKQLLEICCRKLANQTARMIAKRKPVYTIC